MHAHVEASPSGFRSRAATVYRGEVSGEVSPPTLQQDLTLKLTQH